MWLMRWSRGGDGDSKPEVRRAGFMLINDCVNGHQTEIQCALRPHLTSNVVILWMNHPIACILGQFSLINPCLISVFCAVNFWNEAHWKSMIPLYCLMIERPRYNLGSKSSQNDVFWTLFEDFVGHISLFLLVINGNTKRCGHKISC
jgi:hypothetical protein